MKETDKKCPLSEYLKQDKFIQYSNQITIANGEFPNSLDDFLREARSLTLATTTINDYPRYIVVSVLTFLQEVLADPEACEMGVAPS